jgi:hypothetical protein
VAPAGLATPDVLVVDEELHPVGRSVHAPDPHRRPRLRTATEQLDGLEPREVAETAHRPLGDGRKRRDHDPGGRPRLPLADQQVGEQVTGGPAGTQRRPVRAHPFQFVAERGALPARKAHDPTLLAGERAPVKAR